MTDPAPCDAASHLTNVTKCVYLPCSTSFCRTGGEINLFFKLPSTPRSHALVLSPRGRTVWEAGDGEDHITAERLQGVTSTIISHPANFDHTERLSPTCCCFFLLLIFFFLDAHTEVTHHTSPGSGCMCGWFKKRKRRKKKHQIISGSHLHDVCSEGGERLNQQNMSFNLKEKCVTHFHLVYGHILWAGRGSSCGATEKPRC